MSVERARTITIRVVRMGEDEARSDLEFWARMSPDERVEEAWRLTLELWEFKGWDPGEPGLHRTVARIVGR